MHNATDFDLTEFRKFIGRLVAAGTTSLFIDELQRSLRNERHASVGIGRLEGGFETAREVIIPSERGRGVHIQQDPSAGSGRNMLTAYPASARGESAASVRGDTDAAGCMAQPAARGTRAV